jgi:hypothetical protein
MCKRSVQLLAVKLKLERRSLPAKGLANQRARVPNHVRSVEGGRQKLPCAINRGLSKVEESGSHAACKTSGRRLYS